VEIRCRKRYRRADPSLQECRCGESRLTGDPEEGGVIMGTARQVRLDPVRQIRQ
jgi:hypothetical protein